MANQPTDLLQPNQERVSPAIVDIREARNAYYSWVEENKTWSGQKKIAEELGTEIPEGPQKSPEAVAGLDSIQLEFQAKAELTSALQDQFMDQSNKDSKNENAKSKRAKVEEIVNNAKDKHKEDPAKQLAQVLGLTDSVLNHNYPEAFEDLSTLLKVSPDVLQFQPYLVSRILDKYRYKVVSDPKFILNKSLHEVLAVILKTADLKGSEKDEIQSLFTQGKAALGMDVLFKQSESDNRYSNPVIKTDTIGLALELTTEEVEQISSQQIQGVVLPGVLINEFAKIVADAQEPNTLAQQAKLLGIMKGYLFNLPQTQGISGRDGEIAHNKWVKMHNVVAEAAITLFGEDESASKVLYGRETSARVHSLVIKELSALLKHPGGSLLIAEDLFNVQNSRVYKKIYARQEEENQRVAEEKAQQEAEKQRVEQEAWEEKRRQFEQVQADPQYQAAVHTLLDQQPTDGSADSLVHNVNETLKAGKIREPVAQQLLAVLADYRSLLNGEYFRYEDTEVVDNKGLFGVGKKTHMERAYSQVGKKLEEEEARLEAKVESRDQEALTRLAALRLLKQFAGRSLLLN
jgi:hypothetical protein